MADGNGATASDPQKLALLERAFVNLQSVLDDRVRYGASIGMSYNGQRDIYSALGWKIDLSFQDFYLKYQRQDIAARIIDLPVDATWRDGFEIQDDENKPDVDTPFIKSWKALDKRLGLAAWLTKLDRLSGIGRYGVLFLGTRGQDPVTPLAKASEKGLAYLSVFVEPNAIIDSYDTDLASDRFGLPVTYSLRTADLTGLERTGATRFGRTTQVHWSRCIHCAEMTEDVKTLGTPRLQRVFNLLEALQLVTGGSSEAFWRSARPRYHANVGKEAQGFISPEELEGLGDQLAKMVHNYQDWIRTSYTTVDQLSASPADPSGHVAVILDLMSAAVAIPKRILIGSERGELASSQDAQEWAHRVAERQQSHVEPNIIRPFIDRLVEAGIMPEPSQGEYEIKWPDITGPSADQRAILADRIASAEARHAQSEMLGKPCLTRNEIRELLGLDPIDAMNEEVPGETPPLPSKPAPAPVVVHPPGQQPQVGPDGKPAPGAPQKTPTQPEQPAKAAEAPPFVEADRSDADLRVNSLFATIMAAVNAATDRIFGAATMDAVRAALNDLTGRVVERFGAPGQEPDLATQAAVAFMRDFSATRITGIGDTTRDLLRATLSEGLRNSEDQAALARRVKVYFRGVSAGRAKTIATSEAANAVNQGIYLGMAASGVTARVWRTAADEHVRPQHAELEGQIRHLGDPFEVPSTGQTTMRPCGFGDPAMDCNCRCITEVASNMPDSNLSANAGDQEWPRRLAVHERRVLAAVRRGLRAQEAAVLAVLAGGGAPVVQQSQQED